jgi:hypothetical protein
MFAWESVVGHYAKQVAQKVIARLLLFGRGADGIEGDGFYY